jgi:two-component system LytT family response regulator
VAEIRALIVDDEPLARRGIRQLLAPYRDIAVVGECRDGREALRSLVTLDPGLVFLDVQMPGLSGLDVIRLHGADRMPATVFVTAHDEFAVGAFEAQALDYLMKPLTEARFAEAIARVRRRMRSDDALALARRLTALLEQAGDRVAPAGGPPDRTRAARSAVRIAVPTDRGRLLLDQDQIDWVSADDYHVTVHAGGRQYRIRESLTALEARLDPARFARIHRATLVRLDQVREIETRAGGEPKVVLRDGTQLPVSRRRLPRLQSLIR